MREDSENVFYSKIDLWLKILLIVVFFITLYSIISLVFLSTPILITTITTFSFMFTSLFIGDCTIRCKYTFKKEYLEIRSGILCFKIPYKDIKSFTNSNCPISAPASSLDRIKISYGEKKFGIQQFTLVSPRNKTRFIEMLKTRIG